MTLLIAYLLLEQRGAHWSAFLAVGILWIFHLSCYGLSSSERELLEKAASSCRTSCRRK